ncbi:MAG: RNA polymerase sigma factor RpoD/SigA [Bacteroidaceae bacterium]|nr:RNA polymerase sigma factor RpoD/SigA [Bacteroidaceae bacterium]
MRQLKITNSITSRGSQSLEDYLNDISKQPLLTAEEEVKLAQRIRNDDREALERLVCANLRFVVSVAKQYQNQGLTLPDLINEGNIGLIKAAEKFDETRGFKFISYAVWWIRQSILQALAEQSRMVRLPLNQVSAVSRINKLITKFEQEHERKPSADELSELIDETPEKIRDSLRANGRPMSINAPLGEGDDSTLLEVISDENTPQADRGMIDKSLATEIERMLDTLDEREKTIVEMCFGINNREMTLDEISEKFGLSRERVRQIREKALLKLRHSNKKSLLQEYLG